MARALQSAGQDVTVIATSLGAENKIVADTWLNTEYGRVIYFSAYFHSIPGRMLWTIARNMPLCEVVHLNSIFYPPSLFSALIAGCYKKPIIWSPRGELDEKALVYSTWKKKPVLWLIRRFLSTKIVFHSTSPEESERVRIVFGSNVQVVELPNFMEIPARIEPLPERPYLLSIGRIHPKKALENLIAALPLSNEFMQSDFVLKIAGDCQNTYGAYLKNQVAELGLHHKVLFIGAVEGEAKQNLYAGAYFSILPSHTENFGNVVIESLAQGTPVIASRGTPWSMLSESEAGIWTDNSPENMAHSLNEALRLSGQEYKIWRQNAHQLARSKFDIQANIGQWVNTYQSIMDGQLR